MTEPRPLIQTRHLLLAGFWALPLFSLTRVDSAPRVYVVTLFAIAAWTIWRPVAGLLLLSLLAPLGFAFVTLAGLPFSAARAVEGALLALLAGWSLHLVIHPGRVSPSRLGLPVISLSIVVAASALIVALSHTGNAAETVRQLWRQLTQSYMSGVVAPPQPLTASLPWLEVLALALAAERIIHLAKSWSPIIIAAWLGAGTAVAAQTVVNVVQVALSRGLGWEGAIGLFRQTRFGAIYPDLNAAGSIFAMLFLTAMLFAVMRRRWLFGIVTVPLLLLALLGTQSRAALAATLAVVAGLVVVLLVRRGHRVVGYGLAALVLASAVPLLMVRSPIHASASAAWSSRAEMWRVSLKMAQNDPVFGAGAGRFQEASRDYLSAAFIAGFPEAAVGENAHNNLLQVLGEFGLAGAIGFVWLLIAAFKRSADGFDPDRRALIVGLAAFLLSAMFGHPLLIYEIAVSFFFALGLMAGLGSRPAATPRAWHWALVVLVLLSFPWRALKALVPDAPPFVGATAAAAPLDGQTYYIADATSRWRLRPRTKGALIPMRWDAAAGSNCRVQIAVDGVTADEVVLQSNTWVPVTLVIPPGGRPSVAPEVELRVMQGAQGACRLLVGRIDFWR